MGGYAGIEVRAKTDSMEIRVKAAKHKELLETGARRIREIKSLIENRYGYNEEDKKLQVTVKPQRLTMLSAPPPRLSNSSSSSSAEPRSGTPSTTSWVASCAATLSAA